MCWEIPKVSKSEKASAAETAYSVLPTAAFLLTAFLQLKDKSRVGGRNCGWAEFASEISQLPKKHGQSKQRQKLWDLWATKGQEQAPSISAETDDQNVTDSLFCESELQLAGWSLKIYFV